MTTAADNLVALTGNPLIDGLTWGSAWQFDGGAHVLSYSLSLNDNPNGGTWTTAMSDAARRALTAWSNVANLTFVESGSGGVYDQSPADLAFLLTGNEMQTAGLVGLGIPPSPSYVDSLFAAVGGSRASYRQPEGDIALDNYYSGFSYLNSGGVGLTIMLHEIGHALGLKHTDNGPDGRPTFADLGISNLDSNLYTVMSYNDIWGFNLGAYNQDSANAATPMLLDILAIQHIYGANMDYHAGDDSYALGATPYTTWWDAGGVDTIEATTTWQGTQGVQIDLRPGGISGILANPPNAGNVIAYGVTIENAIGSYGSDHIIGNAADNNLAGESGHDTLEGGAGADILAGGTGDDTFVVADAGDIIVEVAGQGWDKLQSSAASMVLPSNVERMELLGSANINGTGNSLSNELTGNSGNNILDGGGAVDVMRGGLGDDEYIVSDASPSSHLWLASETLVAVNHVSNNYYADSSLDIVQTDTGYYSWSSRVTVSFHATDNRFDGSLSLVTPGYMHTGTYIVGAGSAPYFAGLRYAVGNTNGDAASGSFTIQDLSFNGSVLVSFAAHFDVQMYSRAFSGEVTYNSAALPFTDIVLENSSEGIDTVNASVSYLLPGNVENLTLTGLADISGTGNSLGNVLNGNTGSNLLTGAEGNDILNGGTGSDTLTGDSGNDTLEGGTGFDIARYSGDRGDYTIAQSAGYHYTITDNNPADGDDGVDALFGVEQLQFADSIESLQTSASWHGFKHRPITPFWAGTDWQVLDSQRDFDGNGKNDVLLHKPDGSVALWLMDGAERIAGAIFEPSPGRTLIDAMTDYNGDGKTDLSWHEADSSTSHWLMGSGWVASAVALPMAPPDTPPIEPLPPPPTEPLPPPPTVSVPMTPTVPLPPPPDGWW